MSQLFSGRCYQARRQISPIHNQVPRLRKTYSSWSLICNLPLEILDEVFSYLPLPSQVCLALSCKGLYELFHTVLQAEQLRFPHLAPRREEYFLDTRYVLSKEYLLRMELLVLLENSRWACCAACQKLHRRTEFLPRSRSKDYPLTRLCMFGAGLLDLCPCITLSIRDRKHVVEYLMGDEQQRSTNNLSFVDKGYLKDSCNDKGERYLIHQCSSYKTIRVEIVLSLSKSGRLIARARHEVLPAVLDWQMECVSCCRHFHLWRLITRILTYGHSWRCESCHTNVYGLRDPNTLDITTVVTTTRDLGKGLWPTDLGSDISAIWHAQCRWYIDYMPLSILKSIGYASRWYYASLESIAIEWKYNWLLEIIGYS